MRIVSLTVTEGGYLKNPATGDFDAGNAAVVHDLAHPEDPRTAFAYIVEGLRRRRDAGAAPFTVLSCDNLQGNGDYARQAVVGFARLTDPDLATWIEGSVVFPNCMVDRITPSTTDADREAVQREFGIEDRWPVPAEPFSQWIVEDEFPTGRPPLEPVGVQFVDDVRPYELMKLRLLNASHQALAYFGAPLGYVLVDEATRDDRIRTYLERYMADEAAPTLGELPGIDLDGLHGHPDRAVRATRGCGTPSCGSRPTGPTGCRPSPSRPSGRTSRRGGRSASARPWSRPGRSTGRSSAAGRSWRRRCPTTCTPAR